MNEEILIELGVASDETKGGPVEQEIEFLVGCDHAGVYEPTC